jgi:hypothetical protein
LQRRADRRRRLLFFGQFFNNITSMQTFFFYQVFGYHYGDAWFAIKISSQYQEQVWYDIF